MKNDANTKSQVRMPIGMDTVYCRLTIIRLLLALLLFSKLEKRRKELTSYLVEVNRVRAFMSHGLKLKKRTSCQASSELI